MRPLCDLVICRSRISMSIQITTLTAEHMPECMVLWDAEGMARDPHLESSLPVFLELNPTLSKVAINNGKVIGATLSSFNGLSGWIFRLVVAPEFRGKRIGRQLTQAAEKALQQRGATKITLCCEPELIAFYEEQGYSATAGRFLFKAVGGV
jgi:ribosomal protein S18 acetylase RimI-like enzyme